MRIAPRELRHRTGEGDGRSGVVLGGGGVVRERGRGRHANQRRGDECRTRNGNRGYAFGAAILTDFNPVPSLGISVWPAGYLLMLSR